MTECELRGCTETAEHVVGFVNPEEIVEYCLNCATYKYKRESRAVGIMPKP